MRRRRWLFPRLLSFMLPFPFIGIRLIMSRGGDVFSWCPEAAILSAHKYLCGWIKWKVWKWTSEFIITAFGLNCQPLMTGHTQRNATLKFISCHQIWKRRQFIPGGLMVLVIPFLLDGLNYPRFNSSDKRWWQWGGQEMKHGGHHLNFSCLLSIFVSSPISTQIFLKKKKCALLLL